MKICELCGKQVRRGINLYGLLVCGPCHNKLTALKNQTCVTCKYFDKGECRYGDVAEFHDWHTYNYEGMSINIPVNGEDTPDKYNSCYHYRIDKSIEVAIGDDLSSTMAEGVEFFWPK